MRRTPWFRSLATLLAVWFPLIVGEPGVVHPCPMHGGTPAVATSTQPVAHAHHMGSNAAHGTSNPDAPSRHDHHHCTCVGSCTSTAGAVAPADAPTISVIEAAYATQAPEPSAESVPRLAPEYSRPYTTGPPRA